MSDPSQTTPRRWYRISFETETHVGDTAVVAPSSDDAAAQFRRDHPWFRSADLIIECADAE